MGVLLKINNWDELYENSRTRSMVKMQWVPIPAKFDGDGYTELVLEHKNGVLHYAAWMAFVLTAARCDERGTLAKSNGRPHTTHSIASMTKIPKAVLDEALPRLLDIGWIVSETTNDDQEQAAKPDSQTDTIPDRQPDSLPDREPPSSRVRARASVPFPSVPKKEELPSSLQRGDFVEVLSDWLTYKADRKEPYKDSGLRSMLTHAANLATSCSLDAVISAMRRAMANGWKGWDHDVSPANGNRPVAAGKRDPRGNLASREEYINSLLGGDEQ